MASDGSHINLKKRKRAQSSGGKPMSDQEYHKFYQYLGDMREYQWNLHTKGEFYKEMKVKVCIYLLFTGFSLSSSLLSLWGFHLGGLGSIGRVLGLSRLYRSLYLYVYGSPPFTFLSDLTPVRKKPSGNPSTDPYIL